MELTAQLETFGSITKKEHLISVSGIPINELVLESIEPFPGYYSELPDLNHPRYMYLVLNPSNNPDLILRQIQTVQSNFTDEFDATFGRIKMNRHNCPVIRIKNLNHIEQINDIIDRFKKLGVVFQNKSMKLIDDYGIIELRKFYFLNEFDDEYYIDKEEKNVGYFMFSAISEWIDFEKLTKLVKQNFTEFIFDAAKGTIIRKAKIKDIIRIYSDKITPDNLKKIRNKYAYYWEKK